MNNLHFGILFLILSYSPLTLAIQADESLRQRLTGLAVEVGLEYESGDYGTADTTELWRIPVSLLYHNNNFSAGITVPYISAESTGNIVVKSHSNGHTSNIKVSSGAQSVSGLGDIKVFATYYLPAGADVSLATHLTARIKFATANENIGLGSGAEDYAFEAGLAKTQGKQTYFATLGYEFVGDTATTQYDNIIYAEVGLHHEVSALYGVGAALNYSQASLATADDYLDLSGFINYKLDSKRDLLFYVSLGLSNSAADYGAGAALRYSF